MAAEGGFKHIKVTPADEQEVVIHAGAPRESVAEQVSERKAESAPAPAPTKPVSPRAKDDFQPTTLEDIQGSKMPKTQVAIIVLAVLAVVAFVVWYAFFS